MVKIRTAKSKGSQFEYDCQHSLKQLYSDIYRTSERGFQMQFDLCSDLFEICIECKRLKGISWNQLVKLYEKLIDVTPTARKRYVLFQSNRQPCLVFYRDKYDVYTIQKFSNFFGVPFEKHPSTRVRTTKK